MQSNLANALSFSQTQDAYLQKVLQVLDRMGVLLMLAQDETEDADNSNNDIYHEEFRELENYISDVGTRDFNGVSLFDGTSLNLTKDSDGNTWELNLVDLNGYDLVDVFDITWVESGDNWRDYGQGSLESVTTAIEEVAE